MKISFDTDNCSTNGRTEYRTAFGNLIGIRLRDDLVDVGLVRSVPRSGVGAHVPLHETGGP